MTIFDFMHPTFKIKNKIRLIELFAGVGSQAMALRDIKADFEHYKIAEWQVNAFTSYKYIHMGGDNTNYSINLSAEKLPKILYDYGISIDGKNPLTLKEIFRKGEKWQRDIYNNIKATNNLCSVINIKGSDLNITETDLYTYIMTYSFPCQDLSVAGKMRGMKKGSGTRSGLLWEVERILNEVDNLPQVLLMENVPQVMGQENIKDFQDWQGFLESKGYTNYVQILNTKDYGVAQNRERCFMVSILGSWNYKFPKPFPLNKTMADYLEEEVDEKYYINNPKAKQLIKQLVESGQLKGKRAACDGGIKEPKVKEISNCIKAKYDSGINNNKSDGTMIIEVGKINSSQDGIVVSPGGVSHTLTSGHGNTPKVLISGEVRQIANIYEENGYNSQAGRIYDENGISPTLDTCSGGNKMPKIIQPVIVASRGRNPQTPSDRTPKNYVEQRLEPNQEGICNTLTSVQKDNLVLEPQALKKVRNEYGKRIRKVYENHSVKEKRSNMTTYESRTDGIANTLTTVLNDNLLLEPSVKVAQATKQGCVECKLGGVADLSFPESKTRRGRVQDNGDICPTITAAETGIHRIESLYRIRKLIPLECWRLMGFSDIDFFAAMLGERELAKKLLTIYPNHYGKRLMTEAERIQKMSNTQLYKQAGNSIAKPVLEGIFTQMIDYKWLGGINA